MIEVGMKVKVRPNLKEGTTGIGNIEKFVGNEYTIENIEYYENGREIEYVTFKEDKGKWFWDLDWLEY